MGVSDLSLLHLSTKLSTLDKISKIVFNKFPTKAKNNNIPVLTLLKTSICFFLSSISDERPVTTFAGTPIPTGDPNGMGIFFSDSGAR